MFSLEETITWTPSTALERLKASVPKEWRVVHTVDRGWHRVVLVDEHNNERWLMEQADLKILCLDALGWLRMKTYKTQHPVWRPRDNEAPLRRPSVEETSPDPLDLDPEEVAAVYKKTQSNPEDKG